ncbi:MAG: DEAD/DEAH box helicase [Cyanophyceae cyanobacterium]
MGKQHSRAKKIRQLVCSQFGYESLRPGQEEALNALLDRRDTLVVMPTGSGKSAIYQMAALLYHLPKVVR